MTRPCRHPAAQPPFGGQRILRTRRAARSRWTRAATAASRWAAPAVGANAVENPHALMRVGRHFEIPDGATVDISGGTNGMLLSLGMTCAREHVRRPATWRLVPEVDQQVSELVLNDPVARLDDGRAVELFEDCRPLEACIERQPVPRIDRRRLPAVTEPHTALASLGGLQCRRALGGGERGERDLRPYADHRG